MTGQDIDKLQTELVTLQAAHRSGEAQNGVTKAQTAYDKHRQAISDQRDKVREAESKLREYDRSIERLKQDIARAQERISQKGANKAELGKEIAVNKKALPKQQSYKAGAETKLKVVNAELARLEALTDSVGQHLQIRQG